MSSEVMAGWRQRRFPPEFRIGPVADAPSHEPAPPSPEPAVQTDEATPSARVTDTPSGTQEVWAAGNPTDLSDDAAAQVATEVWRAHRRLSGPRAKERPDRAVRMAGKHLAGAADHLGSAGITAHDHDGQPYVLGLELVVLAHEEDPAVTGPTITETVRPTVKRSGRVIQEAEVIVSVPVQNGQPNGSPADGPNDSQDDDQERGQHHA
ncbi:hypothetical protein [Promicromonospora panici]|uniref:hypothetical protein n=1 Tax=Promicromonospora panici TaxID=2219658 RepID=UPI00101D1174|nr:hypothetical protein [Promicromonospora panici]